MHRCHRRWSTIDRHSWIAHCQLVRSRFSLHCIRCVDWWLDICLGNLNRSGSGKTNEEGFDFELPKQTDISIGIAWCKHIMSSRSAACAYYGCRIRIISVVPLASDQEANCAVVREPFHVLHRDGTTLRWQWTNIPWNDCTNMVSTAIQCKLIGELTEQQVKINRNRLQVATVNTPIQVLKRLWTANFIHFLVRESVAWHTEQVNASILRAHCNHVAN